MDGEENDVQVHLPECFSPQKSTFFPRECYAHTGVPSTYSFLLKIYFL